MDAIWLSVESRGDSTVVSIRGDLDIVTSPELDTCLTQVKTGQDRIILDLSAVDFLDTSALAVIVGHWKNIEATGGKLALAGARYRYTKTLWITGLADRLTMYESVDQAVAAQAEQSETELALAESAQPESALADAQAERAQAEPVQAEPVQAEPVQAEPAQAEPVQAESARAEPAQAGPAGEVGG